MFYFIQIVCVIYFPHVLLSCRFHLPLCLLPPPYVQQQNCSTAMSAVCLSRQTLSEPHYTTIHMHDFATKHTISNEFIPKWSL